MKTLLLSIPILVSVILIPLSFAYGDILEVQNMNGYTNKDSYGKGEVIRISGEIQSANGLTVSKDIPITIVLTNDVLHKTMQTLKTYPSPNGNFAVAGIPTTDSSWESSGTYTVTTSYGNIVNTDTSFSFEMGDKNLLAPLKQSKLGIPSDKIECRSDLQLIIKTEDNSTACVTQQTTQTLVERGWTRSSPQESSISITGLNSEYSVGQPINATVNYTGWMNGGLYPDVKILNADNGSKVWNNCLYSHTEQAGGGGVGTATYNVQCSDKYPIINQIGNYMMIASVDNDIAKARFTIVKPLMLTASFEPCDTPYPQSNTGVAVLYMPANSIGKICVRYSNPNDSPEPIGITIFDANNIHNQNVTGITTWSDSTNNTISKGDSTVVYWIKTGNQTGLYGLTFYCGDWNPFAVGYDGNSNMTTNNFPFLKETFPCPFEPYRLHIDSLTGIGVKQIP